MDYEHWFYSYQQLYYMKPDPAGWRKTLEDTYDLDDIMIFADFSYDKISAELPKLRTITNTIIETQQVKGHHKKDMTDFIMLDYIYQTAALRPEIDAFILFTGDGHFQSVAKYLTQRLKKKVIVYGVRDATSGQLKAIATETIEIPEAADESIPIYEMIVSNMAYVSDHPQIIPPFMGTVTAVAKRNQVPEYKVRTALQEMLDRGLLYRKDYRVEFNRTVKVLAPNWEKLHEAGLWSYE